MLHPYLRPIEISALAFPFAALILLIPVFIFQYRRFGHLEPWRWIVFNSFLLYGLAAVSVVLLPLPTITSDFCELHKATQHPQLVPFQFLQDIRASWSVHHFQPAALLSNRAFFQALFNFLLLLPLGVYLAYYLRLGRLAAVAAGFAVSLAFEVTQYTGIFGLYPCAYRLFDVDDLILNTSGAVAGYMMAPLLGFLPSIAPAADTVDDPKDVSLLRRVVAFLSDMVLMTLVLEGLFFWVHAGEDGISRFATSALGVVAWFVILPALTGGFTPGKWLVRIRLAGADGGPARFDALSIRYGLFLIAPMAINTAVHFAGHRQDYFDGRWALVQLVAIASAFAAFAILPLFRADRRGLHELLSNTRNVLALT